MKEVGEYLKNRRIELGISLEEAEQHLKIRKKYIIAIENGDESVLPGRTYFLGYLRNYANFLEVDQDYVNQLLGETKDTSKIVDIDKDKKPKRKTGKYFSPEKRKYRIKKEKKSNNLIPIIGIAIVILLIISAFLFFKNLLDGTKNESTNIEQDTITEEENNLTEEKSLEEELTEMAEKNIENQQDNSSVQTNDNYLKPLPEYKTISVVAQNPVWIKVIQNNKVLFESLILTDENIYVHSEDIVSLLSTSSDDLTVYFEDEEITPKTADIATLWTYQINPHNEND